MVRLSGVLYAGRICQESGIYKSENSGNILMKKWMDFVLGSLFSSLSMDLRWCSEEAMPLSEQVSSSEMLAVQMVFSLPMVINCHDLVRVFYDNVSAVQHRVLQIERV